MKYVLISGRANSGKTTLAYDLRYKAFRKYNAAVMGLADYPKRMLAPLLDIPEGENAIKYIDEHKNSRVDVANGKTVRELLQSMATDWCRKQVCEDIWCRVLEREAEKLNKIYGCECVIIHDVRFKNEVEFFRNRGPVFFIHAFNYWDAADAGQEKWREHESENMSWVFSENPVVVDSPDSRDWVIDECGKWVERWKK